MTKSATFADLKNESFHVPNQIFQLSRNGAPKFISMRRTVLIQSALDSSDPGQPFKYQEHTRDINRKNSSSL